MLEVPVRSVRLPGVSSEGGRDGDVGVAGAGVLVLLANHFEGTRAIWAWVGDSAGIEALRPRHVTTLVMASAVVLLPPAFLMGGVFPLAASAFQRGLGDLGARVGALDFVSHCYLRPRARPVWPYNLFAMVHGSTRDAVETKRARIAALLGPACRASDTLYSKRILKKTGLRLAGGR